MLNRFILCLVPALAFAACSDDYFDTLGATAAEGAAEVTLQLSFDEFAPALDAASRGSAGNSIDDITDVTLLLYSTSGSLVTSRYANAATGLDVSHPTAAGEVARATMTFDAPYGNYRIYAVANMGDLAISHPREISSESAFRSIRFGWNANVGANAQMCGVVTQDAAEPTVNRDAPTVHIGAAQTTLHSWLRRAVSKVTLAFDASALNDNIYIYIRSAQVRDIPLWCSMVEKNVPQLAPDSDEPLDPAMCLTDGETISYLDGSDYTSSRVVLAKGSPYGGLESVESLADGSNVHRYAEEALFFFENMQGTHPKKHLYQNFERKDSMLYGSFIEVKAFYENKSSVNPSKGEITYRYMLGMNDTDDFNAQRNTHYKLTLRFVNDANDPDWHIDYNLPGAPDLQIPSPLYISYLYNRKLDIPVTAYFDESQYYVKSIKAQITRNDYTYPGHKYDNVTAASFGGKTYDWTQPRYGFMSFKRLDNITSVDMTSAASYQGETTLTGAALDDATYNEKAGTWVYNLPVYTRPLNLMVPSADGTLTDLGFSGNNSFTHKERYGRVSITVEVGSKVSASYSKTLTTSVDIVQVPRITNPKGCWRPHNSTAPFTFTLTRATDDAAVVSSLHAPDVQYEPLRSKGPWTARVYTENYHGAGSEFKPGADWICLSPKGANTWSYGSDAHVSGSTNSVVEFDFKPRSTIGADETRFGVIEVLYHDSQCSHLIFVSQGYGTVRMGSNDWMMGNLYANGVEVANPIAEGSMFKFGNAAYAIDSRNNYSFDLKDRPAGPLKNANDVELCVIQRAYDSSKKQFKLVDSNRPYDDYRTHYSQIWVDFNGFTNAGLTRYAPINTNSFDGHTYRMAEYKDYAELLDMSRYGTLFGVVYGKELDHTLLYEVDRYTTPAEQTRSYTVDGTDASGMRGCIIYDRSTGNHLFLPIGATGIGRRKPFYDDASGRRHYNVLKYANRDAEMDASVAKPRPQMYDIWLRPGALYWFKEIAKDKNGDRVFALDINYMTYLVQPFSAQTLYDFSSSATDFRSSKKPPLNSWDTQSVWEKSSDAAFVRRIRVK